FGVFPALIGYSLGLYQLWERMVLVLYVMAAVIRLGYFNVMEEKRQTETSECRKFYQGLPVTSSAIIFPVVFLCKGWIGTEYYRFVYLGVLAIVGDRKSTRLNSSHVSISYAVFCLKKK